MRAKIILVIAIIFGIASTLLLINFLEKIEEQKNVAVDTVTVVVATRAINENEIIRDDMLFLTEVPKEYLISGYARKKEDLVNKLSVAYIAKNEVISTKRVIDTDDKSKYLSQKIKSDKIAITIDVSNERSVGQLIVPNDCIDIIYSEVARVDEMNNVFYNTTTVFEEIKVLAVDRTLYLDALTKEYKPYESVTVEMKKDDGRLLVNYKLQGELDFVLNSRVIEE